MKILKRHILLLLAIAFVAVSGRAQNERDTVFEKSALDYMLQKRPIRPGFPKSRFRDNTFLSVGGGASFVLENGRAGAKDLRGYGAGLQIHFGKWTSPISGFRLGGKFDYDPLGTEQYAHLSLGADYLLNLSALASGYDQSRVFELIGIAGVEYLVGINENKDKTNLGAYLGLQGKFRINNVMDLYIEPRMGLYTDGLVAIDTWKGYVAKPSLFAGLSYHFGRLDEQVKKDFGRGAFSNIYFTIGTGGLFYADRPQGMRTNLKNIRPFVNLGVGKWFTPISGLRLMGKVGWMEGQKQKIALVDLQLDYLLNVSPNGASYGDGRIFDLSLLAGLNYAYTRELHERNFTPGFGVGLHGDFRLSRNVELFIEPRATFYAKEFASGYTVGPIDLMGAVNVGFNFRSTSSAMAEKEQERFDNPAENMFITVGGKAQTVVSRNMFERISPSFTLGLGKWFTSISGLEATTQIGYLRENSLNTSAKNVSASVGINYLFNFSSALLGYKSDRLFELYGKAGLVGMAKSDGDKTFAAGGNFALQGQFNVGRQVGIYIEPSITLFGKQFSALYSGFPKMDGLFGIAAGVSYRLNSYDYDASNRLFRGDNKNFISLRAGAGTTINSASISRNFGKWTRFQMQASYGRWLRPESGLRASLAFNNYYGGDLFESRKFVGINADYLLNITALNRGYDGQRVFNLLAFVGPNIGVASKNDASAIVPGISAGLQANLRLSEMFDFVIEPSLTMYGKNFLGEEIPGVHPVLVGGLTAGINYKF